MLVSDIHGFTPRKNIYPHLPIALKSVCNYLSKMRESYLLHFRGRQVYSERVVVCENSFVAELPSHSLITST